MHQLIYCSCWRFLRKSLWSGYSWLQSNKTQSRNIKSVWATNILLLGRIRWAEKLYKSKMVKSRVSMHFQFVPSLKITFKKQRTVRFLQFYWTLRTSSSVVSRNTSHKECNKFVKHKSVFRFRDWKNIFNQHELIKRHNRFCMSFTLNPTFKNLHSKVTHVEPDILMHTSLRGSKFHISRTF